MGEPRIPLDPVGDLSRRLARAATDQARAFWPHTMRPARTKLHVVPMAKVRTSVHRWWKDHGLHDVPATINKRIAVALIEQPMIDAKLAGIVMLHELMGDQLRVTDLPVVAGLFEAGHLEDWHVVDWFCTKVLVTMLDREPGRPEVATEIARWRDASTTWQRRAACVAFVKLAPQGDAALPNLVELALSICATVVWSLERFDQSAVGWLLRELSHAAPDRVEAFFRRYARLMSKDCARYVVSRFSPELRTELLAHHKRATTLKLR